MAPLSDRAQTRAAEASPRGVAATGFGHARSRGRTSATFAVLALASSSCTQDAAPAPTPPPTWHVEGSALRDPEGRTVVMRGMNLSGAQKWKPYFGFQQPADYARLRDEWGMSSIRFIVTWAAIEPEEGAYDDAYLDEVDRRIGWAEDAGLLVVVDMHQDLYGEGFAGGDGAPIWTCDAASYAAFQPTTPWALGYFDPNVEHCVERLYTDAKLGDHFIGAWTRVAQRLVHHANVVGFDVLNEPGWNASSLTHFEANLLQPFYEKVVPAVRKVAPHWIAFLEPGGTRNAGIPTSLTKLPFADVVYAPHSYDVAAEGSGGFDPARRDLVISNLAALADESRMLGAGLWIGEYGGLASLPGISEYMIAQYDGAGAVGAGTEYWSYDESDGFGFLTPAGAEKPALADAIVRPYPERIAGSLTSYAYDASTKTLTFVMTADSKVTAPTIVSLPPRLYPSGAEVDCGGCAVADAPGSVSLTEVPPGARTITVRPR